MSLWPRYVEVDNNILKWRSTGEVSNSFLIPSHFASYTLLTEYTHLGEKVEGGNKTIPGMQVTAGITFHLVFEL